MTSPPMPSLINPSVRTCASRFTAYCNEQLQAGEEIELESLSKELAGVSEVSFQEFTAEQGYELEESFPADRSTLRQLTKFAGSGGGLTINFDAMLLGERIFWDPATDTLTIKVPRRICATSCSAARQAVSNSHKKTPQTRGFSRQVCDYARTKSM